MKNANLSQNRHGIGLYVSDTLKANLFDLPVSVGIENLCADVQFWQDSCPTLQVTISTSKIVLFFFFFCFFFFFFLFFFKF